ncbi:hypothetical protein PR202_gb10403 [Eleusine coracana subsp. coracana]|uniref:Uncharacterized protein n=1 Tax=Eleusine coracana subsp. coracana TaxID=191504 RepID=A0AAV5EJS7_ELECO|nr:hypothetical protein PR202_gb10403 [Eleusine coracana subsp. coracana]
MGSLMAGWDSPVLGDNKVRARRNRSLTKEEVESFWKQRRKSEDGGEVTSPGTLSPFGSLEKSRSSPLARGGIKVETDGTGSSSPPAARVEGFLGVADDGEGESPSKSRDWWTRSSWAFLNEPPQEEPDGRAQSYAPQFHVARIASTGNAA